MSAALLWVWTWIAAATPLDVATMEDDVEHAVTKHLERTRVPGVVVAVVAGGEIVLLRGWGVADIETQRPMDPHTTIMRVASLSKTFTATAVAQLEDEGRVDLDADVDDYLRNVSTRDTFAQPVTLRHLLAHTAGYINFNSGRVFLQPRRAEDIESFMAATMPPRLYPPGAATLYTNHGNALAGLVVQDVSGMAVTDYVHARILEPLGMHSTSYEVALDDPNLASSYRVDHGEVTPWQYEHYGTVPASSIHSTAQDMARWLIVHAGDGSYAGARVLSAAAMARMRGPGATIHPALPQHHYAFARTRVHGRPARAHGGSIPAFLSRMVVFDEHGVGVFVSQNAFGPDVCAAVVDAVADALPEAAPDDPVPVGDGRPEDPDALVGSYRVADKFETAAFTRPRAVLLQKSLAVELDDEGFLSIRGDRFVRTGELVFEGRSDDEEEDAEVVTVVFVPGDDGEAAWVHVDRMSAYRPAWHQRRWLHLFTYGLAFALLVAGMVAARKHRVWIAIAAASLGGTIVPHAWAVIADLEQPVYTQPFRLGTPAWIPVVLWLPRVAAVASVLLLAFPKLRSRRALPIVIGSLLLLALELYWRTPSPGLDA
jgi:CubicO group peptidase (beta-lactamase class C family)